MAGKYILKDWIDSFEKDGRKFNFETDSLLSNSKILFPGRFYILHYMAQTDNKPYNAQPVIISLGLSKQDPESFLCVDLCLIPRKMRIEFVQMFFNLFQKQIQENMDKFWDVKDADKQKQIIQFSYSLFDKNPILHPFKNAIKKYKIKNTFKIYSIPFSGVYKIIGELCDKNYFVNSNVKIEQEKFIKKS